MRAFATPSVQAPRRAIDVAQLERDGDLRGLVWVLEDPSAEDIAVAATVTEAGAIPLLVELVRGGSVVSNATIAAAVVEATYHYHAR
jgi:hypothetical protein